MQDTRREEEVEESCGGYEECIRGNRRFKREGREEECEGRRTRGKEGRALPLKGHESRTHLCTPVLPVRLALTFASIAAVNDELSDLRGATADSRDDRR